MGIYISGISLPPDGEKRLVLFIGPDGVVDVYRSVVEATPHLESIVCETEAIEVPPHGRLGDLDALIAENNLGTDCSKCKRDVRSCQYEMIHSTMDFCEWIDDAPTIIPADKEEP